MKMKMVSNIMDTMDATHYHMLIYIHYYTGIWECGVCLVPYDKCAEGWWVECDQCTCWFHAECVKLKKDPGARKWFCPACRKPKLDDRSNSSFSDFIHLLYYTELCYIHMSVLVYLPL